MKPRIREETRKQGKSLLAVLVYLLAVLLTCSVVNRLCTVGYSAVWYPHTGEYDLTDFDFEQGIAEIASWAPHFQHYPEVFYTPEDFASGRAEKGRLRRDGSGEMGDYGTLRMVLTLPPDQVYALTAKNASYAQRLYLDGVEYPSIGTPGDTQDTTAPQTKRYFTAFRPQGETTEIVIHYADFAYGDGGGLYPVQLGLAENIHRAELLRSIRVAAVTVALVVALLLFLGLFLLFPQNRYLLWFGLACGCTGLRGLFIDDKVIMALLPDLNWYLAIRLEFVLTLGVGLFSGLYIHSLFPGRARRWAARANTAWCAGGMLYLCLMPPHVFSRYIEGIVTFGAVLVICLLVLVLADALGKRLESPLPGMEQALLLAGLALYVLLSVVGIRAHSAPARLFGLGYPQIAMTAFLFINIIALVMGFSRTERERDAALAAEREIQETNQLLSRLDQLRASFLQTVSHELRTPLTVISAHTGTVLRQVRRENPDADAVKNLDLVQREAVRLADLTERITKVSLGQEWQAGREDAEAYILLRRAADFCEPICRDRRNRITVHCTPEYIPLLVNKDSIFQVLVNLIANANRQAEDSVIALTAEYAGETGSAVVLAVTDQGGGVPPDLLEKVFQRGVTSSGGKGLGLAVSREIVEQHGGTILIENTGSGARVRFTLPPAPPLVKGGNGHEG